MRAPDKIFLEYKAPVSAEPGQRPWFLPETKLFIMVPGPDSPTPYRVTRLEIEAGTVENPLGGSVHVELTLVENR